MINEFDILKTLNQDTLKIYELAPTDGAKSFYGKAKVYDDGQREILVSYGTPVVERCNGNLYRLQYGDIDEEKIFSATTCRHVRAFCGCSKKEYKELPPF